MRHFDSGCCDAKRDARAMGYRNAREADEDNWGMPPKDDNICHTCKKPYAFAGFAVDGKTFCCGKCVATYEALTKLPNF